MIEMSAKTNEDCRTKAHFTFIWTVENASALLVSGCVDSPSFIVKSIENTKWKLLMYKNIYLKELSLQICRQKDNGSKSIEIVCEISILSSDGSPLGVQSSLQQFQDATLYSLQLINDCNEVFGRRKAEFLLNDTLTIRLRMWRTRTEISKTDTCFARTRLGVDRRSFVWAIREFSNLRPGQKRTHFVNPTSEGSPQLILNLFLSEKVVKNYINIEINQNSATRNHRIFCMFSLLDSEGRVSHSKEILTYIYFENPEVYNLLEFIGEYKPMGGESSLLEKEVLYLRCEFHIEAKPLWNRIESHGYSNLEDLESVTNEMLQTHLSERDESCTVSYSFKKGFEDLHGDDSLSDVSLRADGMLFCAHKNILSVRSPVFKAMFTQDMREKSSKIVDMPELNADTLARLLLYIYKDTVEDLKWESAMDLFRAADMYRLLNLRKKCLFFLKSNLSVTNVCSILSLANMHENYHLQNAAEYFISEHVYEVFRSVTWKKFKMENFKLALEITEQIILNGRNS